MKTPRNFRLSDQSLTFLNSIKQGGPFDNDTDALEYALRVAAIGADIENKHRPAQIKKTLEKLQELATA